MKYSSVARRFAIAGALFAACVGLAACSGRSSGATENNGSTLVFGRNQDAVRLDPAVVTDGMSLNVARITMDGLTGYALGSFDIEPALATSWTREPGWEDLEVQAAARREIPR